MGALALTQETPQERMHTAPGGYTTARSGLAMVADLWRHTTPEPANLTLAEWQAMSEAERAELARWCIAALRRLAEHKRQSLPAGGFPAGMPQRYRVWFGLGTD